MNWRRGLFRLWLVGSVAWIAFVVWFAYERFSFISKRAADQHSCFEARKVTPALGNPFDCFVGGMEFGDLDRVSDYVWKYAPLALGPILAVLAVGVAAAWIGSGFKRPNP